MISWRHVTQWVRYVPHSAKTEQDRIATLERQLAEAREIIEARRHMFLACRHKLAEARDLRRVREWLKANGGPS